VTSHTRKSRGFDQQLSDERARAAAVEQERDAALAEVRRQQTLVIKGQQELAATSDLYDTAESQRRKVRFDLTHDSGFF
jgi:hypothetical protein